jgi:hypothetical protein
VGGIGERLLKSYDKSVNNFKIGDYLHVHLVKLNTHVYYINC